MQKMSKRKAQLFLFLLLFYFLLSSFLHNGSTHTIARPFSGVAINHPSFPTFSIKNSMLFNLSTSSKSVFNASDWAKACPTSRSYKRLTETLEEKQWLHQQWPKDCDVFNGKWVYDNGSYPLYDEAECPYMSDQLACGKHGRPDKEYQRWRWQPHGCNLKRWNATEMLEKIRNKRLVFVGDSLNRGQWISMVCLVQSVIPNEKKSMIPNAELTVFKAEEYNATVEFYWAPLLVESNSDDPVNHRLDDRIILPDSVSKHAILWKQADILVFNTYLWWRSGTNIKLLWSYDGGICEEASGLDAMELALNTWADWVTLTVNPLVQKVFFVTMSPTHFWRSEWNPETEGNCYKETDPVEHESYWGSGSDLHTMHMVENVLHRLGTKVMVLNITQLSEYRKDGHPSIYRKFWEKLSPQQLANPASYADCIHWCLPGVPDTWNELLFNFL